MLENEKLILFTEEERKAWLKAIQVQLDMYKELDTNCTRCPFCSVAKSLATDDVDYVCKHCLWHRIERCGCLAWLRKNTVGCTIANGDISDDFLSLRIFALEGNEYAANVIEKRMAMLEEWMEIVRKGMILYNRKKEDL